MRTAAARCDDPILNFEAKLTPRRLDGAFPTRELPAAPATRQPAMPEGGWGIDWYRRRRDFCLAQQVLRVWLGLTEPDNQML